MIVVDTSALYAIAFSENDAAELGEALTDVRTALVGSPTAFEFNLVVLRRHGPTYLADAARLLAAPPFEIVAWDPALVSIATEALARFGGRPASLNYGDCMAYALAKSRDLPLLYKGGDFARTDIRSALG